METVASFEGLSNNYPFFQFAARKKLLSSENPEHWLDHAKKKYSYQQVEDTKNLLKILGLFSTFPIYWALESQQVNFFFMHTVVAENKYPLTT